MPYDAAVTSGQHVPFLYAWVGLHVCVCVCVQVSVVGCASLVLALWSLLAPSW